MSHVGNFIRSAGLLGALSVVARLGGLIQGALLARFLNPSGFGALSVVTSTALSLYGMTRLGADSTLHVAIAEKGARRGAVMGTMILVMGAAAALSAAICLFGAPWIARDLYRQPTLEPWIRWAALYVVAHFCYQYCYFSLAGFHRFASYASVNVLTTIIGVVVVPLAAWQAGTAGAVVASIAVLGLTIALLGRPLRRAVREERVDVRLDEWRSGLKENAAIGFPHYLSALIAIPIAYVLQGMLGRYGGTEGLGFLRMTVSLSALISFIPSSISAATLSFLTSLRSDTTRNDFDDVAALNAKVIWLVTMALYLAIEPFLPYVVRAMFGAEYLPATSAARLALVGAVIGAVEATNGQTLLARRLTRRMFVLITLRVSVMGVVGWFAIPRWQVDGYVLADLLGISASYVIAASLEWAIVGHRKSFLSIAVLTLAVILVATLWHRQAPSLVGSLLLALTLGAILAVGAALLVFSRRERELLLRGLAQGAQRMRQRLRPH